ncbi:MAG TPA: hypothetical protein VHP83_06320 [Aggregatilineaceae bacterium]|nr:hypothetical protein [Aggregatilineaceae bacterium]
MAGFVLLLFLILFVGFLFALFSVAEGHTGRLPRPKGQKRGRSAVAGSPAASMAMRRAGYEAGPDYVQVVDIGLLAYRQTDEPKLVRYNDVFMDTQYLRPFAEVWLPYSASGQVRFELIDAQNRLRYADEAEYDLVRGTNTVLPSTWLPLQGKTIASDDWELRILAGDTLLASHKFGWQPVGGGTIQQYAATDGEISPTLQQALHGKPRRAMSLSELLSDQEE